GGPNARVVEATVSERQNFREPPAPRYEADASLGVDQTVTVQSPAQGWTVVVTRRILVGGQEVEKQTWNVVYRPQQAIYRVHPCKVPGTSTACPTTTTSPPPSTPPPSEGGGGGGDGD